MNTSKVRVRFAPSPTGGLHLGGVRTALFNYLFARKHQGTFVLRIEDTDQNRFVEGAEQYIFDCLKWCGISPDESLNNEGGYGPYRQTERKEIYKKYAEQLIAAGHAYYAFDTPEDLENMREQFKTQENPNPLYGHGTRDKMRNSLHLSKEETEELLAQQTPFVIRIKVPENETIHFSDLIRGEISHDLNTVDDKVLLKADGMPTYHLAAIVDDYLMKITHVFRGEEWLPSAPVHQLLWRFLGWEAEKPAYAHLPLILKPDGNGKLSKRDGERLGFPVFAMEWKDNNGEKVKGFKEEGFLPEAFLNILALLGWNPGTEQEIFTLKELCEQFSLERVHKGGAKFDYEKAKWFNQQHIQLADNQRLAKLVMPYFEQASISASIEKLTEAIDMTKERCHLLKEFVEQAGFLFKTPESFDIPSIKEKWDSNKTEFVKKWITKIDDIGMESADWENSMIETATEFGLKKKDIMLPIRVLLVGGKFGPGIFEIAAFIGKEDVKKRLQLGLKSLSEF